MFDSENRKETEISVPCVYFRQTGHKNTQRTLEIAAQRTEELKIKSIIVASTSGKTGLLAARLVKTANVIVVTHSSGFLKPDHQQLNPELRKQIEDEGAEIGLPSLGLIPPRSPLRTRGDAPAHPNLPRVGTEKLGEGGGHRRTPEGEDRE